MKIVNGKETVRAGELAKLCGVPNATIKYYTAQKMLTYFQEGKNNKRYPLDESVNRVKEIQRLKKKRYTIEEIKGKIGVVNEL